MKDDPTDRQAKKRATRARILEVARLHFERDGFAGASVRAIAGEASVAVGTVLLHFEDKVSLLHAALHSDLEAAILKSLSAPQRGGILNRLSSCITPFFEYYSARPTLSRILLRESLLAEDPWRERFTEQFMRVQVHIVSLVEEAKARGELEPKLSAALFSAALFSFYYFALIGWVQGGLADPAPLFRQLLAQHLQGVALRVEDKS